MDTKLLKNIKEPIFYVTNNVSFAIGLENLLPNFHIVCLDDSPLIDIVQKAGISVFCLERQLGEKNILFRNPSNVLGHKKVMAFIKEKALGQNPNILFFKPQKKLEIIARKNGFNLIGNEVELNHFFENKVTFFELCLKHSLPVPKGEISKLGKANFSKLVKNYGEKLVIQFGRGWAGNSTYFVSEEKDFVNLQKLFGQTLVKITEFIKGRTVLNNAVCFGQETLISEPALQVKADGSLTSMAGGTGGRQWPVTLNKDQKKMIINITQKVASLMRESKFRGFFGLDFLVDDKSGAILLSEVNARLTASAPFFTKLELGLGSFPLTAYHLLSFLPENSINESIYEAPKISGGEIVARNTLDASVKVLGSVRPGIYSDKLKFKNEAYFLNSKNEKDIWLETVSEGRVVNPEIEIIKIDTFSSVCNVKGILNEEFRNTVDQIKNELKLERC